MDLVPIDIFKVSIYTTGVFTKHSMYRVKIGENILLTIPMLTQMTAAYPRTYVGRRDIDSYEAIKFEEIEIMI